MSVFRGRALELLAPEGAALDLAVLRIVVAVVLAGSASVAIAADWAALPLGARVAPLGVGWLLPHLPITPELVRGARVVLTIACVTGGLGLSSRVSFATASIAAFYVLLVPQLGGATFHDHHLLWLAVLLAASPCGDALSVDAWWARRHGAPPPTHGRAYGAAIRTAWILVGLVYFFPGVHKLAESGLLWVFSDNLRNQMWWKWTQDPSLQPAWRIDRHPWLLRTMAALTVIGELGFLPAVLARRTRALAVVGALAFHAGAEVFMGIQFSALWACFPMFVGWSALVRRREPEAKRTSDAGQRSVAVAGALLVAGVTVAGAAGAMNAYPFACYPTFAWIADDHMPALVVEIERDDGALETLDRLLYQPPGPRGWALVWSLAGVYGEVDPARIDAWWRSEREAEPLRSRLDDVRAVRFYRVEISVDPDHRGEERSRREIHVITSP